MDNLSIRITDHNTGFDQTIEVGNVGETFLGTLTTGESTFTPPSAANADAHVAPLRTRIKIAADGTFLPESYAGTDHVAVLFPAAGVMYAVASIGGGADGDEGMTQQRCVEACEKLGLLGRKWQLASYSEAVALVDVSRRAPAIDTNFFPRIRLLWHWTRDALVDANGTGSSASAWGVLFSYGYVSNLHRGSLGFALAVCRVGQ